jgi:predicted deacylase
MTATLLDRSTSGGTESLETLPVGKTGRSGQRLLAPLEEAARASRSFVGRSAGRFDRDGSGYELPRLLFVGPKGGGDLLRIGIFAGIHGDEPEGTLALAKLVRAINADPEILRGYALFLYPLCNPTGFEDGTRHARGSTDLNREFWRDSSEPEVRFIEGEIWMQAFDGIVTLHSDDTSHGLYGFAKGAVLTENLLEPALRAASRFLPRNELPVIDGFHARDSIIHDGYEGMLQSVPGMKRPPFEITLETPAKAPLHLQAEAGSVALVAILEEFRCLQAIGQNI